MNRLPNECPVCGGEFVVTSVQCRECDTHLTGRFQQSAFAQVSEEQLAFIELFVRNEGKITRMESDLGLSYPTIRNRLHGVIRALGHEPNDEFSTLSEDERKKILDDLENGKIDYDEALRLIETREKQS
jgi:hypothetical protein